VMGSTVEFVYQVIHCELPISVSQLSEFNPMMCRMVVKWWALGWGRFTILK
jgi:hypothetical protein